MLSVLSVLSVQGLERGALEASGALRSTANDLLKLLDALLGFRESTLGPAARLAVEVRRPGGMHPGTKIALAWNVIEGDDRGLVWKNGSVGGYRAFIGYDPKRRIGVVAFANAQTAVGVDDLGLHILDIAYSVDLEIPKARVAISLNPKILERYVGRYKYSDTDVVEVTRDGDRLYVTNASSPDRFEIFPESERDFFLDIINAQITFELGPDGNAAAAIWHQSGKDERGVRLP